jgi:hypothetical protein
VRSLRLSRGGVDRFARSEIVKEPPALGHQSNIYLNKRGLAVKAPMAV